ncbi:MAG: hypothetical protein ACLQPD_27515 [Desulfomonilaceae bacterium]
MQSENCDLWNPLPNKPEISPEGVEMNIRYHMLLTVCTTAVLVCFLGSDVIAQAYAPGGPPPGYYYQPPSMAPTGPSMYPGVFYIGGGVRYYNVNGFRFNKPQQETILYGNIGSPPFGPDDQLAPNQVGFGTPITFGSGTPYTGLQAFPLTPTHVLASDPRTSGIWFYLNGQVDARNPGNPAPASCTTTTPPPPTSFCPGFGTAWVGDTPSELMGRVPDGVNGPAPGDACCASTTVNISAGSFSFQDPFSQTDSPTSITGTTQISYVWIIDGTYNTRTGEASTEVASLILDINPAVFDNDIYRAQVWGPSIEIGVQATSLFDIYLSFSGYQTGRSFSKSFNYSAPVMRRAFTDAYPFGSPDTNAWPISSFDSNNTIINDVPVQQYQISVDGMFRNKFPTRTFSVVPDPTITAENLEEDVTHRADINLLEFRWAGRTWVPLWGMGRFGFSLGAIGNAINYKINGTRTITSLGPAFPGTVVFSETGNVDAWIANYGGFVGTDVELGSRNIFVKASGEYNFIVPKFTYQLMSIETEFDPTGFSAAAYAGFRF